MLLGLTTRPVSRAAGVAAPGVSSVVDVRVVCAHSPRFGSTAIAPHGDRHVRRERDGGGVGVVSTRSAGSSPQHAWDGDWFDFADDRLGRGPLTRSTTSPPTPAGSMSGDQPQLARTASGIPPRHARRNLPNYCALPNRVVPVCHACNVAGQTLVSRLSRHPDGRAQLPAP
jgi:hypothetical protein